MTTSRPPITAATALFTFYDIESLSNVFSLCAYTPREGGPSTLEVFYLVDDQALRQAVDTEVLLTRIHTGNPALPLTLMAFHDLSTPEANVRLAQLLGLSDAALVNDPGWGAASNYPADLRPVCDTDADYNPTRHAFLVGYNSMNYDTVIAALYLSEVFDHLASHNIAIEKAKERIRLLKDPQELADAHRRVTLMHSRPPAFAPITARSIRTHNDRLFSDQFSDYMPGYIGWETAAAKIRRSMINSGRHIDAARLNELQQRVGLKRLLGMLGHQIKESDRLSNDTTITDLEDLYELLAYNVADCLGLSHLFRHPAYAGNFDLKAGLLEQYPETRYNRKHQVRPDRLSIDSSSAKFVGRILAPYDPLTDIEAVSFVYPHPEVAKERGIASVNVLDECVTFFETQVAPDRATNAAQAKAYQQFMDVVSYYRSIEGQNFNDSEEYAQLYNKPAMSLRLMPKKPNNLPYFTADGTPSSCFATFSTGGIHGAEADTVTFEHDLQTYVNAFEQLVIAKQTFAKATDFVAEARRQHNVLTLPDGSTVDKALVLLGSDPEKVRYRKPKKGDHYQNKQLARAQAQVEDPAALLATQRPDDQALHVVMADGRVLDGKVILAKATLNTATWRESPSKKKPALFVDKEDGSTRLHPKFTRTSVGMVIHEDFTSYYPNLLRNMRAFYNPDLGEDRYAKIFFDKERYGAEMKMPGLSSEDYARLNTLRNGTKLILNSASGAGDATHKTPIRMNNQIISMRILGQLFSWRIGQAQTLAGARIISTNTDGLYSVIEADGFDEQTNNRVLAEQQAAIGIDIEPEPLFLISKDSNNRLELGAPRKNRELAWTIRPEAVIRNDGGFNLEPLEIHAAGGGTLACHAGPTPTKALAHPAVIDFALARYLQHISARGQAALAEDFDRALGRKIMDEALNQQDLVKTALLFQTMVTASRGSITYPFAADPIPQPGPVGEYANDETVEEATGDSAVDALDQSPDDSADADQAGSDSAALTGVRPLQMVNRAFVVRPGTPGAVSLHNAGAWKVSPASKARREQISEPDRVRQDPVAIKILRHHGLANTSWCAANESLIRLPEDQDIQVRRINGIDPLWWMFICNEDLHVMETARLKTLIDSLNLEVYVQMLAETFTNNWKNTSR